MFIFRTNSLCGLVLLFSMASNVMSDFEGEVVVTWLKNGDYPDREMKLVQSFSYVDSTGRPWVVPIGAVIDGASIPAFFWNTIGPPFVGNYRRASVVHDYYCNVKTQPWKRVHRMFYEASVVGGVPIPKAKIMYAAVYAKGPRWPTPGVLGARVQPTPDITDDELTSLSNWIESTVPSLNMIEDRLQQY
ncbi:MAG TPA: DUF1353 domain-containing protein [bacterium]|nr:DUF1353 domain-containing protein [bacterium]